MCVCLCVYVFGLLCSEVFRSVSSAGGCCVGWVIPDRWGVLRWLAVCVPGCFVEGSSVLVKCLL